MTKTSPSLKLLIFVLVTTLTGFGVATVVGNLRFGSTHAYSAVFTSASGLGSGSDVRVAGVPMGKVTDVSVNSDGTALVTFSLSTERPLTAATEAKIKYKNLIGDRYVDLSPGSFDPSPLQAPIPLAQTTAALDLDQVVNGFRPLLQGLDPDQTNQLSASLIQVLNGQEASISQLISQIDTFTNALADRDQAIGQVIANFNAVLGTVNNRRDQFATLVDQLQQLVAGLNDDRDLISHSLGQIDDASNAMATVLTENRPPIAQDVSALGDLAGQLNAQTDTVNLVLSKLPETYRLTARAGGYGSFVNLFVCGLAIKYAQGPGGVTPMFTAPAERCK
ncbi:MULTISPECIES: MCE family protein [Rhodococcus]|uniref:Putative Mce family protein n=2 Tax=Rhodococcus opacus TaxID=37919 RepID=C1BDF2_RHOOB|nr:MULTISPECIES: MCE family protein [Rhodococcus]EID79029.1 putative Mce family protein [Rhodococcus opacus RKJ300 = JCM 13270]KAF0960429.1 hypothetical protein MLGJGCBP_06444 [Rhodococcus sp. T7]QQZ18283.1 MCE family protein [Rhodococcus sp. 21391]UOT08223.1 MCE family protein [Rhodococcus opacus]BAH55896.1 putative Mce family protein [Rhodococcus opacus B4]